MKFTAILLAFLMILSSCASPSDDVPTPEPNTIAYAIADFGAEEILPKECGLQQIAAEDVLQILAEVECGDQKVAVLLTEDFSRTAALELDGGWHAFHTIGDELYGYDNTIALSAFDGILNHSGVKLTYALGANALGNLYFTFEDDAVMLLVECAQQASTFGMLIEQYGMGSVVNLYRAIDDKIFRYDLYREISALFPNALEVYVNYRSNLRYSTHLGLLDIDLMVSEDGEYERYSGWFTEDSMALIRQSDMVLPPYTYTPVTLELNESARAWLTNEYRFGTDFVLREAVDPTTLESDALLAFMDEAYRAGQGVLFVYEVDSGMMFGTRVYSSTMEHYYVNGSYYNDMQNPAFPSLSAWETYMRRILSVEIVDELMARNMFIEVDGRLYGMMGTRGTSIGMRDIGSKIVSVTEDEIVYARIVEIREDLDSEEVKTEEFTFRYTKCEDGWRWTELYIYN